MKFSLKQKLLIFLGIPLVLAWWRDHATGIALNLRSIGRRFKSYSGGRGATLHNTLGNLFTPMPLSPSSSITWYRYDSVCSHWMSLQGQNLHSGKLIKIIKMLHGHFLHAGKTLTDLQFWGSELHQNAFDGRALPGPTGELYCSPRPPSRY